MKSKVIVIVGPTACGKTSLSVALAKKFDGEIISADSMQIYRGMDIGTAKVTPEQMEGVPHHMIDVVDPQQDFSLADYLRLARECAEKIISRGKLPFLVGGTGLYVSSFTENVSLSEESPDPEYREYLNSVARENGGAAVKKLLEEIDPESYASLNDNDIKRIIRALEVYRATGKTIGQLNRESKSESPYEFLKFGLSFADRQLLYGSINDRVDEMFDRGLVGEISGLGFGSLSRTARQAIGYKQFEPYLNGETDIDSVKEQIKKDSRHYAKRQLTWFRRDKDIIWMNNDEISHEEMLKKCEQIISKFIKN